MKVIYSIGSHFGTTGISNTAYRAVKEIERKRFLKKLICLDYKANEIPKSKIKSFRLLKYLIWFPFKAIQRYLIHSFNPYKYLDPFYDYLASKNLEDCDIFHYWRSHGIKSARKAKEGGAKIFVENASSHPSVQNRILIEEYNKYGIISKPYVDDQLRKAIDELNYADYVVVPKGFAYDSFISEGFDRKKLIAVNFGIDLEKFKDFRKNKKDNKFRAIFVGQVTLRKGIQYLLEAWDKLDLENSELLVVGKLCADSESIVKKYKFNDSIKFLGQTNPMPYYAKSDIFVFPSIEEGSALVTYEAMACGLPQITTFNSGSVVRDGKDGFIIPIRDVKSIKEKINFFYKNPELMKKMSKNAREEVKKYPWSNYGATVLKAYKKAISVE